LASAFTIGEDERRIVIDRDGVDLPAIGQGAPVLPVTVDLAEEAGDLISLNSVIGHSSLSVIMRALERQSGNDLLSAPKLTVLSGKTAEIVVADEFRYPETYGDTNAEVGRGDSNSGSAGVAITAGTPRSFTTRNVGVEMQVTPTVEEDNSVSLRLKPTVTEFEGFVEYGGTSVAIASDTTVTVPSGFYQPVFSVRKVDTEVTIWDGATVVMGGLTREHSVRIADRIPILGDLPVLGRLFRQEGESTQKRNLLIFVTANLVSPGGSPAFQYLPGVEPNTLYQVPRLSTPAGLSER
jgi:general secretion pathway protein D